SAWVAIRGDSDRHLVLPQQADRRLLLFLQRVEGAGKQHGDRSGRSHRLGTRFVEVLEMIGGERAILGGERGTMLVRQLLGMEPHTKAMVRRRLEQALNLFRRESDGVAKGIDAGGEPLL